MNKLLFTLTILFLIPFAYSLCSENQIDVNSASLEELDEIYGIGPAKAQAIIDSRPYETLDDLTKAYGIGSVTLENIKSEGLACVSEQDSENTDSNDSPDTHSEDPKEESSEEIEENDKDLEKTEKGEDPSRTLPEQKTETFSENSERTTKQNSENKILKETIVLNPEPPKTIKTSKNSDLQEDKKYSLYALVIFCIFLGALFIFDKSKNKNKNKNEFRNTQD